MILQGEIEGKITKFMQQFDFGQVIKNPIRVNGGLLHKMFKVETNKGIYCVKVLNPEVMARKTAYKNFVISEKVSNLAKKNNIPVSSALEIDGEYLKKYEGSYYMLFDFVQGKTLKDDEITIEHCRKIGKILADIHLLDYNEIDLNSNIVKCKNLYDWDEYLKNIKLSEMPYKDLLLKNYKKYNSILKRANERFNSSNINQTITHSDMDPKNVMWHNDNPVIIDWECAGVSNPERELLEVALCWSGFLSNKFDKEKFAEMFREYSKYRNISNIEWYDVICGNLVGRFEWLKYNIERSLGIVSDDIEEMKLAENEVLKTINEINRYLELIGEMYDIICEITALKDKDYSDVIGTIIEDNEMLKGKKVKLINSGFTNTIYVIEDYIIRICTDGNNEERFLNEIEFYKSNDKIDGIAKLYVSDITKSVVPYYYEIIEKVSGNTLYEVWSKLSDVEKKNIISQMVDILKSIHSKNVVEYDFKQILKSKLSKLKEQCNLSEDIYSSLVGVCDKYFIENKFGFIHGDLHFDNFIYDGNKLTLLDFERCMVAPIDYDFKIFSRYSEEPWLWASGKMDMMTVESDYNDVLPMILECYKELQNIPFINQRLKFYSILEMLENYKNTKDESKIEKIKLLLEELK